MVGEWAEVEYDCDACGVRIPCWSERASHFAKLPNSAYRAYVCNECDYSLCSWCFDKVYEERRRAMTPAARRRLAQIELEGELG